MVDSNSDGPAAPSGTTDDDGLSGVREDVDDEWGETPWGLYGLILGTAACIIVAVQVAHVFVIAPDRLLVSILVLVPALIAATYGMATVLVSNIDLRLAAGRDRSAADFALILGAPTVVITLQLFAGVSFLLWRSGFLVEASYAPPSLWALDGYFMWQLLSAVPVVDIPGTLNWQAPLEFAGPLPGALTLGFKVILIVPIIGVATGLFSYYQADRRNKERESGTLDVAPHLGGILAPFRALAGWTLVIGLAFGLLWLGVSSTSPLVIWLDGIAGAWLATVARVVTISVIFAVLCFTLPSWMISPRSGVHVFRGSIPIAIAAMVGRAAALGLAAAVACGITVTLISNGAREAVPTPSSEAAFGAAVDWYANQLAAAVPFLEIPSTLRWTPACDFVGATSVWLLLVLKFGLVFVLFLPVVIAVNLFTKLTPLYETTDNQLPRTDAETMGRHSGERKPLMNRGLHGGDGGT